MKISNVGADKLLAMSVEQKWNFLCGEIKDEGQCADFALLLGTKPCWAKARALAAAKLYVEGRVQYVVPSGGVKWEVDGKMMSEANYMTQILLSEGVPQAAIILENEATTTRENMIYGSLQINRKTKFVMKDVMIVTSINHMKRSYALAKTFLPRMARISYYPSQPDMPYEACLQDPYLLDNSISLIKKLVDCHIIDDCELGFDLDESR